MKKLLLILNLLTPTFTFSCSCNFYGDFLETIERGKSNFIIGKFINLNENGALFKIESILSGKFDADTIKIIRGNGGNCLEPLFDYFDYVVGKSFLINPFKFSTTDNSYGISECGTNLLVITNDTIKGRISGGLYQIQEMKLNDLLEIIKGKYPKKLFGIKDQTTNEISQINGKGQRIGKWKTVGVADIIVEEGEYDLNGNRNGTWKYYLIKEDKKNDHYQRKSLLKKTVQYKSGQVTNVLDYYDENGEKLETGQLVNGRGILYEYYDDGKIQAKYSYKKGIKEGFAEEYYEYGTKKGNFKSGKKNGTWSVFQDNELQLKEIYKKGELIKELWTE